MDYTGCSFCHYQRDAQRRISTVEPLAVQEAAPEEVVKDLTQLLTIEEKSAKIKLDLLNTYTVQEVTTDTTAEETKTFIEERVRVGGITTSQKIFRAVTFEIISSFRAHVTKIEIIFYYKSANFHF